MTKDEILKEFDTPASKKIDELRKTNNILENQIKNNSKKINNLLTVSNQEQEVVANKLDRKYPQWRTDLVKYLK